jgi:hypothetical protein
VRGVALVFLLGFLAVGCVASAEPAPRKPALAELPAPERTEEASAAACRFELVEIAWIKTRSTVELRAPLASTEPGVQVIEGCDITIEPETAHDIETDSRGNRLLHARLAGPARLRIAYRVLRTEVRAPLTPARELRPEEKSRFAADLELFRVDQNAERTHWAARGDKLDEKLNDYRRNGQPARTVLGIHLPESDEVDRLHLAIPPVQPYRWEWFEVYSSGRWEPVQWPLEKEALLPEDILVVTHGAGWLVPYFLVDGSAHMLDDLEVKTRRLDRR